MALADNDREPGITLARTYGICVATSCPSSDYVYEADNILKTKDRKRLFSKNEAEKILKTDQLPKTIGMRNLGDKLYGQGAHCTIEKAGGGERGMRR
jgi:hypothetical protein